MKITTANRHKMVKLIDELVNARNAMKSAAKLAAELGSGSRTTDTAGAFELRAFKLDFRACQYQDALAQFDARAARNAEMVLPEVAK